MNTVVVRRCPQTGHVGFICALQENIMPRLIPLFPAARFAHQKAKLSRAPEPGRVRELHRELARLVAALPKMDGALRLIRKLAEERSRSEDAFEINRQEAIVARIRSRIESFERALKLLAEAEAAGEASGIETDGSPVPEKPL